jgi:pyruvate dehydrogenase E2 component (dihydrolipoamide acetyltransferase)
VVAVIVAEGEAVPELYRQQVKEGLPERAPVAEPSFPLTQKTSRPAKVAPAARQMAKEKGIDLSLVTPTGPHETIMKKDVEAYLASAKVVKESGRISSLAKKVAEEFRVSLEDVQGTGTRGRIMKTDVLRAVKQPEAVSEEESLWKSHTYE